MTSLSQKKLNVGAPLLKGLRHGIDDVNLQTKTAGAASMLVNRCFNNLTHERNAKRFHIVDTSYRLLVLIFCFLFIKMTLAIK
jgi:hypothetical protein